MCLVLKKSLIENHKPFITLSDKNLRLEKAIAIVDDLSKVKEIGVIVARFCPNLQPWNSI
jgi:hypothetical protein